MASIDVQTTSNNNVEEHKRVSFGGEKQIVYDDGVADDFSLNHVSRHNTSFTHSDAPPNKVTVTSENFEFPRPISPPAQLDDTNPIIAVSPALPSFLKKMENESNENPFRPQESLYHEVDPIVEAYRQRPFPPSPTGSPVPSHQLNGVYSNQTTPLRHYDHNHERVTEYKEGYHHTNNGSQPNVSYETTTVTSTSTTTAHDGFASPYTSTTVVTTTKNSSSKRNGSGGGVASRTASLAEARSPNAHAGGGDASADAPLIDGGEPLPPPHKAKLVHIEEKKKKCACCCLQ